MNDWWRGAVIYQIYPRSFFDSNNDGIGDLKGVASHIGYIKKLGVDGVWLSPFFKSPMKDFGYDVSAYTEVDPLFGTLEDFDTLLAKLHESELRLIIDQVYSHTSDQHPWFRESRASRSNARADWYVWADAKPDGSPPNNWLSVFGGPAWSWDTRRRQYYLHNFLAEQPDLNFHDPNVRSAVLDVAKFWLDRGVDGYRLDVANFYYCDALLRDNPPRTSTEGLSRPYLHQRHLFDRSQPETVEFIAELRAVLDQYKDKMSVAEIVSDLPIERSAEYAMPGRLHTAYSFVFLESRNLSTALIRSALESWNAKSAWPSWSFSNHDVMRAPTRWGGADAPDSFAQLLLGVLMCLRGTIYLYQGEELGLPQAHVPFDQLKDPEGIRFWPDNLGRDGCRTPMPWIDGAPNAGFSASAPWLPVDPQHTQYAVDRQDHAPSSTLNLTRKFITFRKNSTALRVGNIKFVDSPEPILMFQRLYNHDNLLCIFNLSDEAQTIQAPASSRDLDYGLDGALKGETAELGPYGGLVLSTSGAG